MRPQGGATKQPERENNGRICPLEESHESCAVYGPRCARRAWQREHSRGYSMSSSPGMSHEHAEYLGGRGE
jgi:hypothetical protein